MVFYGLGIKGLGPKLYGTFEGGRLEEFIDSTSISVKDWCEDSRINREVAKCVADYHSQDFPLVKQPINIPVILEESYRKYVTIKDKVISLLTTEEYETAKDFFEFDALTEASWMRRVIPLINSRVLFCHTDVNRNNNLVRISDNKLVLIDYEFSSYFFRGCEIGNYFDMKMFDFGAEKFRTGYGYPSKEYREEFIKEYIKCIKINGHFTDDWDEAGRDSFDHIVMESEFGAFAVRLINIVWCLRDSIDWITITRMRRKFDPDMEFGKAFTTFVYFYRDKKKEFLETYPEFDV
jgi:thiamine kinase-like enzyme